MWKLGNTVQENKKSHRNYGGKWRKRDFIWLIGFFFKNQVRSDMIVKLSKHLDFTVSQCKDTFNTKQQAQVFCNHFPNLNTAFLHKCVAGWSQAAQPTTSSRAANNPCFLFEGNTWVECSLKEGREKGQKYPESWVYNWPVSLWAAQQRGAEATLSLSETLHAPSHRVHSAAEAHLTSVWDNTGHWIVNLEYRRPSSWLVAPAGQIFWITLSDNDVTPVLIQGVSAGGERPTETSRNADWVTGKLRKTPAP